MFVLLLLLSFLQTHFFASYSYAYDCPPGYFYDAFATTLAKRQCRLDLVPLHISQGIRAAVFGMSSVALLFVLFNLLMLVLAWNSLVFKAASRSFMLLILVMLALQSLGAMLYAVIPSPDLEVSEAVCIGRAWLTCLPLAGILAVLLAKNARLNSIFGAQTLQVKKHTDSDILRMVVGVCLIQIGILLVFTILPLSRPLTGPGHGSFSERAVTSCSQENGFMNWFAGEIVFICCLMLPAGYLGFKTRDLPSQYSESSHIQNALVLLLFFGAIVIPLDIFIQDTPEAAVLIQGLGQSFLCLILTLILFGPKLYYLSVAFKRNAAAGYAGGGGMMGTAGGMAVGTMAGTQLNQSASDDTGTTPIGGLSRKLSSARPPVKREPTGGASNTPKSQPQSVPTRPTSIQLTPLQPPQSPHLVAAQSPPSPQGGFRDLQRVVRQPTLHHESSATAVNQRPMPVTVIPPNARRQSSTTTSNRPSVTASTASSRGGDVASRTSTAAVQLTLMPDSPPVYSVFVPGPASPLYVSPESRSPSYASVAAAVAASQAPQLASPSAVHAAQSPRRAIRVHLGSTDLGTSGGSGGVGAGGGSDTAGSSELSRAVDRLRRTTQGAAAASSPSSSPTSSAFVFPSASASSMAPAHTPSPHATVPALTSAQELHARSLLDKLGGSSASASSSSSSISLPPPTVQQVAWTADEMVLLHSALAALMASKPTASAPASHS